MLHLSDNDAIKNKNRVARLLLFFFYFYSEYFVYLSDLYKQYAIKHILSGKKTFLRSGYKDFIPQGKK